MILKASQRGGGLQLYRHLTNELDNDHVTLHDIRGFASSDPKDAVNEAYAISLGTRCRQYLFSLSLSPPETERVPVDVFEDAITKIEERMGLVGQPRFIYFHEKEGRRHAHCVWSRINADEMKAVNLPYFKTKLRNMSKSLYIEHGWKMPKGLMNSEERDPLNFTLAELKQATRQGLDPREIKKTIQECWAVSDSRASFEAVLNERGYYLAQGNKARHVILDWRGNIYGARNAIGTTAKVIAAKIGASDDLPTIDNIKTKLAGRLTAKTKELAEQVSEKQSNQKQALDEKRLQLISQQRSVRKTLIQEHQNRKVEEVKARSARLPTGLKSLWFRLTGKYAAIKKQNENETVSAINRDRNELQKLIEQHRAERRALRRESRSLRHKHSLMIKQLDEEMATIIAGFDGVDSKAVVSRRRVRRATNNRDRSRTMH